MRIHTDARERTDCLHSERNIAVQISSHMIALLALTVALKAKTLQRSMRSFVISISVCMCRVIRELEAQLEYEREKREKLEAQLDKLRAQIHTLTLQLEDERGRHVTAVGTLFLYPSVEMPYSCGHEDLPLKFIWLYSVSNVSRVYTKLYGQLPGN